METVEWVVSIRQGWPQGLLTFEMVAVERFVRCLGSSRGWRNSVTLYDGHPLAFTIPLAP